MNIEFTLNMNSYQHAILHSLLYPGDGREAVSILLCARRVGKYRHRLVVREICPILTHWYSNQSAQSVTWSTDALENILDIANEQGLSIVKVHSHPNGYPRFSNTDDIADQKLLPAIRDWLKVDWPHGSAVMLPDGQLFGRVLETNGVFQPINTITVVGDQLKIWFAGAPRALVGDFTASHAQAFGQGTIDVLRELTVAIVGCSGTGSPVVEQLARLGVKRLILVDDDVVEDRNINRIFYTTRDQAERGVSKIEAVAEGIRRIGIDTEVITVYKNLAGRIAIETVASADVVFGCMDSIEGRYILNRLATYYSLPYFDIGIRLLADGEMGVNEVCGTVHYLQPGGSSLLSRELFSMNDVAADALRRRDPVAYKQQIVDGYIRGSKEQRPAVISVNMLAASLAVNEFLARLHPYRDEANAAFASVGFSLASMEFYTDPDGEPCPLLKPHVGRGDVEPMLGMMEFAQGGQK